MKASRSGTEDEKAAAVRRAVGGVENSNWHLVCVHVGTIVTYPCSHQFIE